MSLHVMLVCIAASLAVPSDVGPTSLINSLLARQSTMGEGTVRYTQYQFIAAGDFSAELATIADDQGKPLSEIEANISAAAAAHKIIPLAKYTGVIFYRKDHWRLSRARDGAFTAEVDKARDTAAEEKGARVLPRLTLEEVASDGEHLTVLEDNQTLSKRPLGEARKYTQLRDIDCTFLPWTEMRDAQLKKGETNEVETTPTVATLKQVWPDGAKGTWRFSIVKGYAPIRVELIAPPDTVSAEKTYRVGNLNARLPAVEVAVDRARQRDGKYRVDCWLVSEWSADVSDVDLAIAAPTGSYVAVDERFGQAVPKIEREDRTTSTGWSALSNGLIWLNVLVIVGLVAFFVYRRFRRSNIA